MTPVSRLGLAIALLTVSITASAQSNDRWNQKRPWVCAGFLSRESRELKAFQSALELNPRTREWKNQAALGKGRLQSWELAPPSYGSTAGQQAERRQLADRTAQESFAIFQETIDADPYQSLGATTRASLVAWTLLNWFEIKSRTYEDTIVASKMSQWLVDELRHHPDYSANDADRVRESWSRFLAQRSYFNFTSCLLARLEYEQWIAGHLSPQDIDQQWAKIKKRYLSDNGNLKQPGSLKSLVDQSMQSLQRSSIAQDKKAVLSFMQSWVKAMKSINPVDWAEVIECFKAMRATALQMEISNSEIQPLFHSMQRTVEGWGKGQSRNLGLAFLQTPYGRSTLPQ